MIHHDVRPACQIYLIHNDSTKKGNVVMKTFSRLTLVILAMALCLPLFPAASAQEGKGNNFAPAHNNANADATDKVISINSELVVIDVSVMDKKRNFIAGLDKSSFRVFEDQVEQQIELFSQERAPMSIGLVIDTSGSMRFKLRTVLQAAKELVKLCRPGDEIFVVDMKDSLRIRIAQPVTGDFELANKALDRMFSSGGTALLDGILAAGKYAQEQATNRRRALVVMSDGDERDSTIKLDDMLDEVREMDVQVYLMGFPEGIVKNDGAFMEASSGKARSLLRKIAEESGGQAFFPEALQEITPIATKIGEELRAQYTIGYYPNSEKRDGRFHRLHVKLADKGGKKYSVRTRSGYTAAK